MIRLLLLLALLAGLVLFGIANLAPVSLVILGTPTVALPLAFWIVGAIGAGALTTIVFAGLIEFTRLKSRPASPRPASRSIGERFSNFRAGGWSAAPSEARPNPRRSTAQNDDWEGDRDAAWENWDEPAPRSTPPQSPSTAAQTPVRDREDTAWSDWQGYEDAPRRQPPPDAEPIPYRDRPPINFEADQKPSSRSQTGSVYSYSYRPPDEPIEAEPLEDQPPAPRSNSVYDAEFRVITPPYRPAPETPPPRTTDPADGEWDFGDEDDGDWERGR